MKISILNLGISNIESIRKAISFCGYKKIYVTNKKEKISNNNTLDELCMLVIYMTHLKDAMKSDFTDHNFLFFA